MTQEELKEFGFIENNWWLEYKLDDNISLQKNSFESPLQIVLNDDCSSDLPNINTMEKLKQLVKLFKHE